MVSDSDDRYYHLQCSPVAWTSSKASRLVLRGLTAEQRDVIDDLKSGRNPAGVVGESLVDDDLSRSAADILADFDRHANMMMDPTNRVSPGEYREAHETVICTCPGTITGIQHYSGVAHPGEHVYLVREPDNPYDRNAIAIHNVENAKVGHLRRQQAAVLAPILDDPSEHWATRVEASISSRGSAYNQSCVLTFVNIPEAATPILTILRRGQFTMGAGDMTPSAEVAFKESVRSQADLDAMFEEALKANASIEPLPATDLSRVLACLNIKLFDYQERGLHWMLRRETCHDALPALWEQRVENGQQVYYNGVVNASYRSRPAAVLGGLLCDDVRHCNRSLISPTDGIGTDGTRKDNPGHRLGLAALEQWSAKTDLKASWSCTRPCKTRASKLEWRRQTCYRIHACRRSSGPPSNEGSVRLW